MAAAHNKHRRHRILKFGLKLTVVSLVVLGASVVFGGGGKVSADSFGSCPGDVGTAGFQEANDRNWGVPVKEPGGGPDGGNMAGLVVQAYDASTNKPVDFHYTLKSSIDGKENEQAWNPTTKSYYDYNARIFDATNSSNGSTDFSNRRESYTTGTGYASDGYATIISGGGGNWQCSGWSAFGPQNEGSVMAGNGRVLDCGSLVTAGGATGTIKQYTEFWFSGLSDPSSYNGNPDNGSSGYWSVDITNTSNNTDVHIDHWNEGDMHYDAKPGNNDYFNVNNGANAYVTFKWHKTTPPPPPSPSSSCSSVTVVPTAGEQKHITITGTDADVSDAVIPANGQTTTFNFEAVEQNVSITWKTIYDNGSPPTTTTAVKHCLHAQCTIKQVIAPPGEPQNTAVAGEQFTLEVQLHNDNTDASAERILSNITNGNNTWYLSLTEAPENGGSYKPNAANFSPGFLNLPGQPYDTGTMFVTFTIPADFSSQYYQVTLYPDMWGGSNGKLGDNCASSLPTCTGSTATCIPVYRPFSVSNEAQQAALGPTQENPTKVDYYTTFDLSSADSSTTIPAVYIPVTSTYKANGATKDSNSGGTYSAGTSKWAGNSPDTSIAAGPNSSGQEYCALLNVGYTAGYIGPGGPNDVIDTSGGYNNTSCDHIVNEPYFKVYGAGAAADLKGVEKADAGDTLTCTAPASGQSGLLAGWNDNTDLGADRGAGSQLSALALLKITGFASAQTNVLRKSPTPGADLSFANGGTTASVNGHGHGAGSVSVNTALESPALGGYYGAQAGCVKPPQPETSVAQASSPGSLDLNGGDTSGNGYSKNYKGNLTLTNSRPSLSGNTSVFVDGDVYINSNLQLNQTGWGLNSVPSFTLTATGDIFIAPGVTNLDGLYVSSGTIYTCGNPDYKPMAASQLYDSCHNQLVFTGSVLADQVKMMRTFGSLRDEKANQAVAATPTTYGNGPGYDFAWTSGGPPTGAKPAGTCSQLTENSDSHTWYDNWFCLSSSSGVQLSWTSYADSPDTNPGDINRTPLVNLNTLKQNGYPYCTQWTPNDPDSWGDNWLCLSKNIGLTFNNSPISGQDCQQVTESSDPNGQWNNSGYWLCAPYPQVITHQGTPGSPVTANLTPACSHAGRQILPYTCAAEVIQFSPELYLGNQTIDRDSNGSPQYDSITSLPPVL